MAGFWHQIQVLAAGVTDSSGNPLTNGTVQSYAAGTTTLQTLYMDRSTDNPHPNPLTLNADGSIVAYAQERVKLVISDSTGTVVKTIDHVGISNADLADSLTTIAAGDGLTTDNDGALQVNVDGSTITITNDTVGIPNSGVNTSQIANSAVTTEKILDGTIATADIADDAVTSAKVNETILQTTSSNNLRVVRARISESGSVSESDGDSGISVNKPATGQYTVTLSDAFTNTPTIALTPHRDSGSGVRFAGINAADSDSFEVITTNNMGSASDCGFHFIAVGR